MSVSVICWAAWRASAWPVLAVSGRVGVVDAVGGLACSSLAGRAGVLAGASAPGPGSPAVAGLACRPGRGGPSPGR